MKLLAFVGGYIAVCAGAWFLGNALSSDAIGMVLGLLFGIFGTLPGMVLVLVAARRNVERDPFRTPPMEPPTVYEPLREPAALLNAEPYYIVLPQRPALVDGAKYDPLFMQAVRVVQSEGYATAQLLERKLPIGHPRALRLLKQMEQAGAIQAAPPPAQLPGPVTLVFEDAQGRRATMQFSDPDAARRFLAEGRR